jgi:hypothetical protein
MQHFEKKIKPPDARRLAKHIFICEPCREIYLTLDEASEIYHAEEFENAPQNFTENIMVKVRAEKMRASVTVTENSAGIQTVFKIIWSVSAIIFAIGLTFMLNPDLFHALTAAYPFAQNAIGAMQTFGVFAGTLAESISQIGMNFSAESFGITALVFAAVIGTLLYVLHSTEKAKA